MPSIWLRRIRRLFSRVIKSPDNVLYGNIQFTEEYVNTSGDVIQSIISKSIMNNMPLLVTRFGSTELSSLMDSRNQPSIKNVISYLLQYRDYVGYRDWVLNDMSICSGFYPSTPSLNMRYYKIVYGMLNEIDVLASWMRQEKIVFDRREDNWDKLLKCTLKDLEPFRFTNPWSKALEGRKVLVIHPFEATIKYQYTHHREMLFKDPNVLPKFDLLTIKAVQSIAGNRPSEFPTWFEAFDWMKKEIDKVDFDVAIIGCGAYGMPLAGYIKKKGKIAIHMGGATQYLFGIRSKRADDNNPEICSHYNEYWIRPFPEDRPKNFEKVEGGCYW